MGRDLPWETRRYYLHWRMGLQPAPLRDDCGAGSSASVGERHAAKHINNSPVAKRTVFIPYSLSATPGGGRGLSVAKATL
jgi:hypothetical protein